MYCFEQQYTHIDWGNFDYISSRGMKYCLTQSGGNIFCPTGANIIKVARKYSQHLFCDVKKQTKI